MDSIAVLMGRYTKLGKPTREISPEEFEEALSLNEDMALEYRAYVVLVYWTGARRAEPLNLKVEDISVEGLSIFIKHLPAFKHGHRTEVIELSLELPGVELLEDLRSQIRREGPLFNFCAMTGYRKVIKVLGIYPHWLRYNRLTGIRRSIDGKNVSLDDAKAFTGIKSDRTMQGYGMTTNEGAARVSRSLLGISHSKPPA